MKTKHFIRLVCVSILLVSCSSLKTTTETIQKVTQKIESKDFTIRVNQANPMRMRQIFLTSDYDLRIKKDSAFAYLPYYGVAYVAPYDSNEGGIKFARRMTAYTVKSKKSSGSWIIHFKVRDTNYNYDFFIDVFNNGSADITVNSYERDAISFTGEMVVD